MIQKSRSFALRQERLCSKGYEQICSEITCTSPLCNLCVLCVSVVETRPKISPQSTRRVHREEPEAIHIARIELPNETLPYAISKASTMSTR